jgi:hypothetical protein
MKLFKRKVKDDLLVEENTNKSAKKLPKFLTNKKIVIPCGVVLVIILGLVIKSLFDGGKMNYYDTMASLFTNELGSFSYTFDVRTGEKGSLITENKSSATSVDELSSVENADTSTTEATEETNIAAQEPETEESKNEFQDWNKYADVKTGNWQYPNYKIVISGCTTSLEPLTTDFTVSLATVNYNDKFTEVVCIDGNYYFDIESMYNWLKSSGDSYLISLTDKMPNGSKWLVVPESEFKIPSRYAEDGEKDLSYCTSLKTMYERFLVALTSTKSTLSNNLCSTGMSSNKDTVSINLAGSDATNILKAFKGITTQSGDWYDSLLSTGVDKKLYTEDEYKQAVREKDNVMEALSDLATYLNITDLSSQNLAVQGSARTYTNGKNNATVEGSLAVNYSTDTTDYIIQFSGLRSGDADDIKLPQGSQTKAIDDSYLGSFNSLVDYLNITPIKTSVQLEINPTTISDGVIEKFIDLVNDTGTAGEWITKDNVFKFIEKYASYKETDETTNDDKVNAKLVADLADAMNKILGGVVVTKEVQAEETVEQYPEVNTQDTGVYTKIKYDSEKSDSQVAVFHVEAINKGDETVTVDTTNFSLRTLLNSVYPSNNETLIHNYDNTFDMSKLVKSVELPSKGWAEFDLYFVISDDTGHMDMYFGDTNLGSAIEY